MLDAYLASEAFADMAEATRKTDRGRIERHLKPLLGKKHAHLVGEEDVRRAFAAIRDGKTKADVKTGKRGRARVRGGRGAAREAIIRLSIIYNWASRTKFLPAAAEVRRPSCAGVISTATAFCCRPRSTKRESAPASPR
jgi:hypothetical protein